MSTINRHFLPVLAVALLIASCFGFSNANAEGPSVSTEIEGLHGVYSFASFNGTANFSLTITNDGTTDFSELAISPIYPDDTWEENASFSFSHSGETSEGGINIGNLLSGAFTVVDIHIFVGEGSIVPMTNEVAIKFQIDADNNIFESADAIVVVTNWIASQSSFPDLPDTETYSVGDSFDYQILIKNIAVKLNEEGTSTSPVDIEDQITIQPGTAGFGWSYSSDDPEWGFNSAVFDGLDAGVTRTLNVTVTLIGQERAGGTVLELQASSADPDDPWGMPYTQTFGMLTIPVTVAESFGVSLSGGGTEEVDLSSGSSVASWVVKVNNLGNTKDDFSINWNVEIIPAGWELNLDVSETTITNKISDRSSDSFNVVLNVPSDALAGETAKFSMVAVSNGDNALSAEQDFTAVVVQHYGLSLSVDNNTKNGKPGESIDFIFNVTNTGNGLDTFNVTAEGPNTWIPSLSNNHVNVSAVSSGQLILTVTIPADKEAGASSGNITVSVVSSDGLTSANSIVSASTQQVFDIDLAYNGDSNGTLVIKQEQGLKFLLNVTNDGNGPDTLTFSLANEPSWAELRTTTVTVGRASTYVAIIDLSPDSAALSGRDYTFQVIATSSDGTEWTSPNFKVDIQAKTTTDGGGEVTIEEIEEEESSSLPGFGLVSSLLILASLVLIRRKI